MTQPVNLCDFERLAKAILPPMVFDYFASGAGDEITRGENQRAFDRIRLRPRMLVGVGDREQSTTLFGRTYPCPIAVAPMAFQKLAHADGEPATAAAAGLNGITFTASTMATTRLEEIAVASTGPKWFQLYVFKDRGVTRDIVLRAKTAGFQLLQVTADVPVMGRREGDMRNQFHLPADFAVANFEGGEYANLPAEHGESGPALYTRCRFDADLTWKDVEWLAGLTDLPLLVKGILRGDDAVRALDHGAKGVIVSNHGGRQLDTVPATIEVLPEIVAAMGSRGVAVLDGGIRRGIDVLKAIALGAKFVQVGRPVLWGLAVDGQRGAERVLGILREEFDNAMALAGCRTLADIGPDLIWPLE